MPIYVNGSEAGKLYVMANPPLQIGKVYRKDAGGSGLIYSGSTSLLGQFSFLDESYYNVNGSLTQNDSSMMLSAHSRGGYAGGMAHAYTQPIDVSGYGQIVVNVTEFTWDEEITLCRFGLAASLDAAKTAATFYGQGNAKALGFPIAYTDITGTGSFVCNIPAGTSTAIVAVAFGTEYLGGANGGVQHCTIDSFTLE